MNAHVYILRCADGTFYVGETGRALAERVGDHMAGLGGAYTKDRLPVELVWSRDFARYQEAIAAERLLKGWSQDKFEALIGGEIELLPDLSERRQPRGSPATLHAASPPPVNERPSERVQKGQGDPALGPSVAQSGPVAPAASASNDGTFDITAYLPYLVNRTGVHLAVAFSDVIARHGINLQMWRVLAAVNHQDGLRISDLASLTSIDISTLSRLLGNMEKKSLLARERAGGGDARVVTVHLSDHGATMTKALIPVAQRSEAAALEGFTDAEIAAFKQMLNRVYANISAESVEAAA